MFLHFVLSNLSVDNVFRLAITRGLCKFDRHGNICKTKATVEFSIEVTTKATNAANMNMNQALAQEKHAVELMKSAPSLPVLGDLQVAEDTLNTVIDDTVSLTGSWGPFIEKVKMFTEMMDKVAEVNQ